MTASVVLLDQQANTGTSTTITLSGTYVSGDRIVIPVQFRSSTVTVTISDGSSTFNQVGSYVSDGTDRLAWFEAIGVSAGAKTITITFSSTVTFRYAAALRVIGSDTSASQAAAQAISLNVATSADAATSGNMTPSSQPNVFIGVMMTTTNNATITQGTGFTSLGALSNWNSANADTSLAEWKRTTSTSAAAATFTLSVIDNIRIWGLVVGEALLIDLVSPRLMLNGQTGVAISGSGFGTSQGAGTVKICPTDNVADANAVTQTVTAWGDTSITFTAVQGSLSQGVTCYLFVTENGGKSNPNGYPVQFIGTASLAWRKA